MLEYITDLESWQNTNTTPFVDSTVTVDCEKPTWFTTWIHDFFLRCNRISHNFNCFETIPSFITTVWECHFPPYFYAPSKLRIITLKWTYKMYWYRSFWDQNLNQQLLISASTWLCTCYHVPANSVWCWSLSATISTHVRQSMKKTLLMLVTSPSAYPVIWESLVYNQFRLVFTVLPLQFPPFWFTSATRPCHWDFHRNAGISSCVQEHFRPTLAQNLGCLVHITAKIELHLCDIGLQKP
jgi:hypothetical protein